MTDKINEFCAITADLVGSCTLKKLILSKPEDKAILKSEGRLIKIKDTTCLQLETFTSDGKARHENISADKAACRLSEIIAGYRQCNAVTTGGEAQLMISKNGKATLLNRLGHPAVKAEIGFNNKQKNTILKDGETYPFLELLGVTRDGHIVSDKKAKYHQIERFLEYIGDIFHRLPSDGELYVLDLCCGKSYLTFAAYWYLTEVRSRKVKMLGMDLKSDVIRFCSDTAKSLGYGGLSFVCGNILEFEPERSPDLVLSLHACDIATDIVLETASKLGAKVILSTPCCQHQLFGQLNTDSVIGNELSPMLEFSLLKQRFSVALTDALRCKRLQSYGYSVDVTELVDPENTPKNLLIKACKIRMTDEQKEKYRKEFEELSKLCGVSLFSPTTNEQKSKAENQHKNSQS